MPSKLTGTVKKAIKNPTGAVQKKLKDVAKPATEEGIATNFVGYVLSIPLSFAYDFAYNLIAKKVITNQIASDILKVAIPAGVGAIFHFGKLPGGNVVAGTGYGIAIVSAIKIIIARAGGISLFKKPAVVEGETETLIDSLWGVE